MRFLVLSRRRTLYTTRRLVDAAGALGHQAQVVDPTACAVVCCPGSPAVLDRSGRRALDGVDGAVTRMGAVAPPHALAVVRQLESLGVPVVNRSSAIVRAGDKLRTLQLLDSQGLRVPRTVLPRTPAQVRVALRQVGGPPVVVKLLRGTHGVGVILAESRAALEAILETLWSLGHAALVQEFVAESRGCDVRVLVVDGRVAAAMRRTASGTDFRANLHRGGAGSPLRLPADHERAALAAARVLGLDVAGVDLLEAADGPRIVEVNASPGIEGLERATGVDIARAVVECVAARAARRSRHAARAGAIY